jgi:hypothetical protein
LRKFYQGVVSEGGLYQTPMDNSVLQLIHLDTVMINYSYSIDHLIQKDFKKRSKETFIRSFVQAIREMNIQEFDIYVHYDALTSPMGWSGSIPLKFTHKSSGKTQWMTLQLRRGTVINSGPNIGLMQKAVNILFEIFDKIKLSSDPIVNINGGDTQEEK